MKLTYDAAARWLLKRVWLGLAAGILIWAAWLGSLLFADTRLDWHGFTWPPVTCALALGDGETDIAGQIVSVDHLAFYSPARMIREGREADIYTDEKLFDYQVALFAPGRWNAFEKLRNPPFWPLFYVPTSYLPYRVSCWIWTGIGLVCLYAGVYWLGSDRPARATLWSMTFLPVFAAVSYGQNSLLSFAMLCGSYRLFAADRPFAAGLAAGLLLFKPQMLLGFFVWWVLDLRRYWASFAGVAVTGVVLLTVSYPLVPEAWRAFFETLPANLRFDNFEWWKAHNARAFWRQLLTPETGVRIGGVEISWAIVLWGISALAGVGLFVKLWQRCRDDLAVMFGASVLLMLWATPHAMIYEWTAAVVPAVLWWTNLPRLRPALLVLYSIVWIALFVSTDAGRAQEWIERHVVGLQTIYVFQLSVPVVAWACWQAYRLIVIEVGSERARPVPVSTPTPSAS